MVKEIEIRIDGVVSHCQSKKNEIGIKARLMRCYVFCDRYTGNEASIRREPKEVDDIDAKELFEKTVI